MVMVLVLSSISASMSAATSTVQPLVAIALCWTSRSDATDADATDADGTDADATDADATDADGTGQPAYALLFTLHALLYSGNQRVGASRKKCVKTGWRALIANHQKTRRTG